jgi:hypothetical protein
MMAAALPDDSADYMKDMQNLKKMTLDVLKDKVDVMK